VSRNNNIFRQTILRYIFFFFFCFRFRVEQFSLIKGNFTMVSALYSRIKHFSIKTGFRLIQVSFYVVAGKLRGRANVSMLRCSSP
jgi:hypothetical protein